MTKKIPKNRQNEQYWLNREKQQQAYIDKNLASDEQYNKVIQAQYDSLLADINKRIDSELSKLANENGISIADMRAKVSQTDIKQFEAEAKRVVAQADKMRKQGKSPKFADWSQEVNDRLKLYNATMRINRLEYLKAGIGLDMITAGLQVDSELRDKLFKDATKEQKRQAGILGENNAHIDTLAIGNIILAKTKSNDFSQRIWTNMDVLQAKLSQTIMAGITTGQSYDEMARRLKTQVSKDVQNVTYATQRIARTEATRVQTEITMNSLKRNGYDFCKWYKEPSACHDCALIGNQDNGWGKGIYKVKDVPTIPVHPNCRCAVGAYWVENIKSFERSGNYRIADNSVDINYLHSKEFKSKFNKISDNSELNSQIQKYAVAILTHRQGTDGEDSYIFNLSGKVINKTFGRPNNLEVGVSKERVQELLGKYGRGNLIGLHNHPTNIPPTGSDFMAAGYRGYRFGIIICHNGNLYKYKIEKPFQKHVFDKNVEKYLSPPYNLDVEKAFDKVVSELERFGVKCEKL